MPVVPERARVTMRMQVYVISHSMQPHAAKAMSHTRRARRHGQYGRRRIDDGGGGDGSDYNGSEDSGSNSSSARWRH